MELLQLVFGALMAVLVTSLWRFVNSTVLKHYLRARRLREQGVRGPEGSFWSGNDEEIKLMRKESRDLVMDIHSHDYLAKVLPHFVKWSSQYGEVFMYYFGGKPRLYISDPELVKQVLSNKFSSFTKTKASQGIMDLLGKGLVLVEGEQWARHRRVLSPAFAMDKLKVSSVHSSIKQIFDFAENEVKIVQKMTGTMADCAQSMLDQWRGQEVVDASVQFQELTADVISHTAFGSSYAAGKEVFLAQKQLQQNIVLAFFNRSGLPFSDYLPTELNKRRWKLEKKLRATLVDVIEKRLYSKETGYGDDLLGLMLAASMAGEEENVKMSMDEIIDECKTFFFAGHETTSHLLTWAVFLLSTHQEWQRRLREEVLSECGKEIPDQDNLSKLKLMTMALFEALRLYSPVIATARKANKDTRLGSLMIPEGMEVMIPMAVIHHSKEVWGPDSHEFNPLRFQNGVTKAANHPNAMLAFSMGPRACIGQNFALMEAKTTLSMILQRFSFTLSPDYEHMPMDLITLQPQKGLRIVLKALEE